MKEKLKDLEIHEHRYGKRVVEINGKKFAFDEDASDDYDDSDSELFAEAEDDDEELPSHSNMLVYEISLEELMAMPDDE